MKEVVVIAIGGNSLVDIKDKFTPFEKQKQIINVTAKGIAEIIGMGYRVALTHGNGPQVGYLLLQSHYAQELQRELPPIPLDIASSYTQASIGYLLQQAISAELKEKKTNSEIVTVVSQVVVEKDDPAFKNPTKFIGTWYPKDKAKELREKMGWIMKKDSIRGYRRVVPSPEPKEIVEIESIKKLLNANISVICVGGGGIPVVRENGRLKGVAAVIDKDLASALLAKKLGASYLLISTQVEYVYTNFGKLTQRPIKKMTLKEAEEYLKEGEFPEGSMKPKIEASIRFIKAGGKKVVITDPHHIVSAFLGKTGTTIVP